MPLSPDDFAGMNAFLALSRRVKTNAGVERFDKPIGEQISALGPQTTAAPVTAPAPAKETAAAITPARLISLRDQIEAAKDDQALRDRLMEEFRAAVQTYAAEHSLPALADILREKKKS